PGWVAHPEGEPAACIRAALHGSAQPPKSHEFGYVGQRPNSDGFGYVGAIGPEGGFSESELELALRAGARLVALGPRVLRGETAALVLAALLSGVTGEQ